MASAVNARQIEERVRKIEDLSGELKCHNITAPAVIAPRAILSFPQQN
jgi:hypothetical protein